MFRKEEVNFFPRWKSENSRLEHERNWRRRVTLLDPVSMEYWLSIEGRQLYSTSSREIIKFRKGRGKFLLSCCNNSPCFLAFILARKSRFDSYFFGYIYIYIYMSFSRIYIYIWIIYDVYIELDVFVRGGRDSIKFFVRVRERCRKRWGERMNRWFSLPFRRDKFCKVRIISRN